MKGKIKKLRNGDMAIFINSGVSAEDMANICKLAGDDVCFKVHPLCLVPQNGANILNVVSRLNKEAGYEIF